ncbi:Ti-type conjugative transfer relaxase TraA [Rhizobium sp. KAs_5_22]|uniref:Ti-type conjugative transfer relaxase TraA n=1 Tax=Ciceribacter selenitireducens TaxID=448181 RepID=UPI00048C9CAA|nr:Ti-type conjugative transfer relaxase TraA [Ciceribacter selenitireducens]PPJ46400.1 Ti-type conjugative transfer relaxase TraA [Rhizobium sp. KAs_5_22]
MAIYHCSMKPVARSGGRSAVAAVAYRTASRLLNERDGLVHDFTRKSGVVHTEIVLPDGVEADWARDRSNLWNAVEFAEKRKDARVAREFEIALPHELSAAERLSLTRDFVRDLANRYGAAVDFAIHQPGSEGDVRNIHAHVLMTTRTVEANGLGEKTLIERENKWLLNHDHPTAQMQLRDIRQAWEAHANRHLVRAGLDVRIDHRSHLERGLEIEPTEHMGVHASQIHRQGREVSRTRIDEEAARRNADLIREKPEQVLSIITGEKSVFDRYDVARALHRYIDDPQSFQNAFAAVMASTALVELRPAQKGELARLTTREMLEIEQAMVASASMMGVARGHGVDRHHVDQALNLQDEAIRARTAASLAGKVESGEMVLVDRVRAIERSGLSEEQRAAVRHITGPEQIAVVIGFAGAGKSTMLSAAREAWERQGYRVHGAALAGKAAEGLEESSGISSRTLASWEYGWQRERGQLGKGDVLVIDEAGMVGSRQLAKFVTEAETRGAKLVLVGDHEQLQAIGAGSPFRAIAERVGAVELSEIRRQNEGWQREASIAFATHRTSDGLSAYADRGHVQFADNRDEVRSALVRDYLADMDERTSGSRIALAHRRVDVRAINADIRASLQERGKLARDEKEQGPLGREVLYQTNDGERSFAPGDRIVLLENNRDLGVKNGMLGTVQAVEPDALQIRLDGAGQNSARVLSIPTKSYQAFDHGYATTIHKSQGATVDRAFVMASGTMDRHLTYVAMTRHRDQVKLYAGRDKLKDLQTLSASMGRSGAKETTLDYTRAFAERRGLAQEFGVLSEIGISCKSDRTDDRPPAHFGAWDERVRAPTDRQSPTTLGAGQSGQGIGGGPEKIEPLIPAITHYSRSVEDVAREKARPDFERAIEAVRALGRDVYVDPEGVVERLSLAIVDKGMDGQGLAKLLADRPEQFGELRGKVGLFGENKERKAARHYARAFRRHAVAAAETWERRLEEERRSEIWKREKQDVIEVPGLSRRSEVVLKQLDGLTQENRPRSLEKLLDTQEGQEALAEAEKIARAIERRFGSSDPRALEKESLRLGPEDAARLDRIKGVARIAYRAQIAELTREYELKQRLSKGLGLGM